VPLNRGVMALMKEPVLNQSFSKHKFLANFLCVDARNQKIHLIALEIAREMPNDIKNLVSKIILLIKNLSLELNVKLLAFN
jgi:hypothetical protein